MTRPFNFPKEKQQCVCCGRKSTGKNKQRLAVCEFHNQTIKKYSRYEVIKIYEKVLAGYRKRFPVSFWKFDGKRHARILIRYLIEEKLRLKKREQIPLRLTYDLLREYKLLSIYLTCFQSLYTLLDNAYPGRFKPWEFEVTTRGFWRGKEGREHAKAALRWFVEKRLKIPLHEVPLHINIKTLTAHGLSGLLGRTTPYQSQWELVNDTYPGLFKPWDFKVIKRSYWQGEQGKRHIREATKWLIEEKLKIPLDQIPTTITVYHFKKHRLNGALSVCGNSPAAVIENAYPGLFKPWDFKVIKRGYWQGEQGKRHAGEATRWLIEEKLKIPLDQIPTTITTYTFYDQRLTGVLSACRRSIYGVINNAYPGRFKPEDFARKRNEKGQIIVKASSPVCTRVVQS
ncbi:DUF4046 domain-containing protein [Candidatus Woesearchaeota archaeon]|nr:DUF4046 domain-containing protein [Candidatus Woesearchaeota archaeon]